jgi:valyl-tRNA synthetase
MIKNRLYADDEEVKSAVLTRALSIFENMLKMVHPFMPFVTEEIWQLTKERRDRESISTSEFPEVNIKKIKPHIEEGMKFLQDFIYQIRALRGNYQVKPNAKVNLYILDEIKAYSDRTELISRNHSFVKNAIQQFNQKKFEIPDSRVELRYLAIQMLVDGKSLKNVSLEVHKGEGLIRKWLYAWLAFGEAIFTQYKYKHLSMFLRDEVQSYIRKLAKVEKIRFIEEENEKPKLSSAIVVLGKKIYIPLEGLIDLNVERQRLQKEITRLEGSLAGIEKKLSNEKFVSGAPADVVDKERTKQRDWQENLRKLKEILENLN